MPHLSTTIGLYLMFVQSYCCANPSVIIDQGPLEGVNIVTHNGRTVSGFLGIPYAKPPIGKLRFKAPQPPKTWTVTYRADNDSRQCTQVFKGKSIGSEDCLYLNVYTPQLPEGNSKLLPVMVYIHGGKFKEGSAISALHGAGYILDYDVVLVVLNYRLGVFGFLSTGDQVSPGNYALKDQTMALRWVQSNVGAFGGDADQVTLFGISAGAASAHLLSLSKKTEGLFHKLILQSGTAVGSWAYRDKALAAKRAHEIAKAFNCPTNNSTVLVRCLRSLKASSIGSWSRPALELLFVPTNEPKSQEAFLTETPQSLVEQGKMRDVPWICGNVRDEGLFTTAYDYADSTKMENTVSHLNNTIKSLLQLGYKGNVTSYVKAVMAYYFNDWNISKSMVLKNYTTFLGDMYFLYPTVNLLQAQTRIGSQAGYMYFFEYRGTFSTTYENTGNASDMGVAHGDDTIYLFPRANTTFSPLKKKMSQADVNMMKRLTGLWTSFAINGVPTLSRMENAEKWRKYDDNGSYLRIGNSSNVSLVMKTSLYEHRMNFWRELVGHLNSGSEIASASVATIFIASYVILSKVCSY